MYSPEIRQRCWIQIDPNGYPGYLPAQVGNRSGYSIPNSAEADSKTQILTIDFTLDLSPESKIVT